MRLVQLADNVYIKYVARTVQAFADAARDLQMEPHLCALIYPDDAKNEVSDKSILTCLDEDDILVLHIESWSTDYLLDFLMTQCRKVVYYYGGLEPESLKFSPRSLLDRCALSYQQLAHLSEKTDLGVASTSFNAELMNAMGFRCPVLVSEPVVPSLFCTDGIVGRDCASGLNVLSVGDVLPNRNYEDVLRAFRFYQMAYDAAASLNIIANTECSDSYYLAVRQYAGALSLSPSDALSEGQDIEEVFKKSNVLLSLSKSEDQFAGYVTAMRLGIPIVAYAADSVDGMLGNAYRKLSTIDIVEAAKALKDVSSNGALRSDLISRGMQRAQQFEKRSAVERIKVILGTMIGGDDGR